MLLACLCSSFVLKDSHPNFSHSVFSIILIYIQTYLLIAFFQFGLPQETVDRLAGPKVIDPL